MTHRDPHRASRRRTASLGAQLVAGLFLALGIVTSTTNAVAAEEPLTWSMRPANAAGPDGRTEFSYEVDPGATISDFAVVDNFGTTPLTLKVYASDAFNTTSGGFDLLAAGTAPTDVGAWTLLAQTEVTVPPAGQVVVPFTTTVPPNATPGDHSGGIVASLATAATDASGDQVVVDRRVGSRIYLRVKGELAPGVTVQGMQATYDTSWNPISAGAATVTYTVVNTGNVRLQARQLLSTDSVIGLGSAEIGLPEIKDLLPGESITITDQTEGIWPLGLFDAGVTVTPYTDPALDPAPVAVEDTASFWAIPWPQLAVLALVALAVFLVLRLRRRRRDRTDARIAEAVERAREEARAEAAGGRVEFGERRRTRSHVARWVGGAALGCALTLGVALPATADSTGSTLLVTVPTPSSASPAPSTPGASTPGASTPSTLPATGSPVEGLLAAAALLVGLGTLAVRSSRRWPQRLVLARDGA